MSIDLLALSLCPVALVGGWSEDHQRAAIAGFMRHSMSGDCARPYPPIYGIPRDVDARHNVTGQRLRRFVQHGNTRGCAGIA